MIKNVGGLHVKYRYFCLMLTKLAFSRQFFENYSKPKFHANPSRRDEANYALRNFARKKTLKSANMLLEDATDITIY